MEGPGITCRLIVYLSFGGFSEMEIIDLNSRIDVTGRISGVFIGVAPPSLSAS